MLYLLFWLIVLPFMVFSNLWKDIWVLYIVIKVVMPMMFTAFSVVYFVSRLQKGYMIYPLLIVMIFVVFFNGYMNNSINESIYSYGRFLWYSAIPGMTYFFSKNKKLYLFGEDIYKYNKIYYKIVLMVILAVFIIFVVEKYARTASASGLELWVYQDSKSQIRFPDMHKMMFLLGISLMCIKKKYSTAYGLVIIAVAIIIGYYVDSKSLLITLIVFSLVYLLSYKLKGSNRLYYLIICYGMAELLIALSPILFVVNGWYGNSWYVRGMSIEYVYNIFKNSGISEFIYGFGMYSKEYALQSGYIEDKFFWASDIKFIGAIYEMGLLFYLAYVSLVMYYLVKILRFFSPDFNNGYMGLKLRFGLTLSVLVMTAAIINPRYVNSVEICIIMSNINLLKNI